MAYTVDQAIQDTQRHLHGTQRQQINVLASTVTNVAATITFNYELGDLREQSIIGIDTELMYVVSTSGLTATVIRGFNSTAAAHTAGALVEVNPRFPKAMILRSLQDEIRSWPAGLFSVQTVEFPVGYETAGFDLSGFTGSVSHILDVRMSPDSRIIGDQTYRWTRLPRWEFSRHADPDFPSGFSLTLPDMGYGTRDYRVTAAVSFNTATFTTATDLEATVGLAPSMLDIPPIGAAARLLVGKEVIRTSLDAQGQTRRAEEVPPGYAVQTVMAISRLRDKRISEETMRLRKDWPIRGA